ncbi:protein phosphatase 1 regulatory subunit 3A-like [Lampris incognitus]|uniref:protein phosphatase 1 regulatory subunit 3A-like n=1 Tax=Lampris incognitus TaxID=2546036 RepID=UPI0024B5B544|nr:protein phosphatase 1 regulatory subunit 3A-like [Lampris incognitus]
MSFVTIPSQEDAVTRLTTATAAEHDKSKSPLDEEDEDEDEEDEDEDEDDHHTRDPRFIERRSPVPKKRGQSIFDETAEYLRIRLALPVVRRGVSFADTTGRDLVDVKEFVAFDSDEEEAEEQAEEAARYRKPQRKCTYQVKPDFALLTGDALMRAVRANRVEIEALSPVEDEPLAFSGIVRVLDISFDKAVYIRSTMDNWATYFDHPADYIQGSHDGGTDKFSFKLSFAPPYLTHGSRIEFVVRYETSDGDHWANNSQMNYAVALLVSYEDEKAHAASDARELRGILRPPKDYSMPHHDDEDKLDKDEEHPDTSGSAPIKPTPVRPAVLQPELDLELIEASATS